MEGCCALKFIWKYLKKYPGDLLMLFLGMAAFVAVTLGLPTMVAFIIDHAIVAGNMSVFYRYMAYMVVFALVGVVGQLMASYFISKIVNDMTMKIRNDVYAKMQTLSHHEFQELGVPSLTTRITTDAFILLQFTQIMLRTGMTSPLMIAASIFMITTISPALGAYIIPIVPIILLLVLFMSKLTLPISEDQQASLDRINQSLRENITGTRVVRAFNRQGYFEKRFAKVASLYKRLTKKLFKLVAVTPSVFSFLINITIIMIMLVGSRYIEQGQLQVGNLFAFIEYAFHILISLMLFANIYMMYPRAVVSAGRLQEVLDTPITVENPDHPVMETDGSGRLEFRHVDFAYPDAREPVLRDISFSSKAGETVAFIGSTGSGKSTIVKLIPRFYDVTKGAILVDGVDVRDLDLAVLRDKIGFTPQKANLFTGEIADNLRYGKADATEYDMDEATSIAQAREFIERLETRYHTQLSEGGSNLSGGQKQRLSIARSIIGGREIYIFDDSFSALDYKTDAAVRQALKEETKNATTIIVAQRVGTIMHADQIIVLDHGEIAARGTHEELLKTSPLYYDIASSQLSEEELAR